ncbi:MAG: EAL domain-containing protein [Rhodospirillaceae bacterium]
MRRDRDRYAALAFCWADLVFQIDPDGNITFASGALEAFVGQTAEAVVGTNFTNLVLPEDQPLAVQFLKLTHMRGRTDHEVIRLIRKESLPLPMDMAGYLLDDAFYLALRMRAREARIAVDQYERNPISGLLGLEAFSETASERIMSRLERGTQVAVSVVNMRDFPKLEGRMGEGAKTSLNRTVGAFLRATALDDESAAAFGHGQYALVHEPGVDIDAFEAELTRVARLHDPEGKGAVVETAILDLEGASTLERGEISKGLIYAMNQYQQRAQNGLSIVGMRTNISQLVNRGITEANVFKQVIEQSKFRVALQPIVNALSGDIHHYEALCRFHQPGSEGSTAGESPFRYISLAEEIGLIHDFDLAMATKVMGWLAKKPRNSDDYRVAVNISGYSIGVPAYVDGLQALLEANPWSQGKLLFEITESSRMTDLENANTFIQGLRSKGYAVCLDDFGAGAASFQYLSALEVDVVKIDGSAIRNAMRVAKGRAFLSALTELCRKLGVQTIAEMVDSPEALHFVRDCGCDFVQGYLFGRPSTDIREFDPLPGQSLFGTQPRRVVSSRD